MYLIDTNVISERRKGPRANTGVQNFFRDTIQQATPVFLSAVTIGELRRGVELIRHRGDRIQAASLEAWLNRVVSDFSSAILSLDSDAAQIWGRLRVPHPENVLDKQIGAIALLHGLTVVSRNTKDFNACGIPVINPFH